jgi:plastocyanin
VRLFVVFVVLLAFGCASAVTSASTTAMKKKACPVKRVHESKRARVARRACVARRRRAARKAAAAAAPKLVPVPAHTGPAPAVAAPVVVPETPAPAPVASALGVDAFDLGGLFALRLTRVSTPAGTLTIYYRNRDSSEHNLWIAGPGADAPVLVSGEVGENATATKRVAVSAGTWSLYCSLPGHESMRATIAVG